MALDKQGVARIIKEYVSVLNSVNKLCDEAADNLQTVQEKLSEDWRGEAASAMDQALADLRQDVLRLCGQINEIAADFRACSTTICSNWVEKDAQ